MRLMVSKKKNDRKPYAKHSNKENRIKKLFAHVRFPFIEGLRGFAVFLICALVGGIFLLGIAVGTLQLHRFITTTPFFATKYVDVTGNLRLSKEEILRLAGINMGDNCLAVSIAHLERELLASSWVEEVSVKRLLPDRFSIRIKERQPAFWVRKEGTLFYADTKGAIIAPVETENFVSLPTLQIESGSEDVLDKLEGFVKDLRAGLLPVEFQTVSGISINPGRGVELHLEDRNMRLSIAADDWRGNLERLALTLKDLARRNELGIVLEVRAADGNVWVIRKMDAGA